MKWPGLTKIALILLPITLFSVTAHAQERSKYVIYAKAGVVNVIDGQVTVLPEGAPAFTQLLVRDTLKPAEVIQTGRDSRAEILLNPGSFLRLGENSRMEFISTDIEDVKIKLIRGSAVIEATGDSFTRPSIEVRTPAARMRLIRRGIYKFNITQTGETQLLVLKGRALLPDSTLVKGGYKVSIRPLAHQVSKLDKADKQRDTLDSWSRERALALAKANRSVTYRDLSSAWSLFYDPRWSFSSFRNRFAGCWVFDVFGNRYLFVPFSYGGWMSPYGFGYPSTFVFYGGPGWRGNPAQGQQGSPSAGSSGPSRSGNPGVSQPGNSAPSSPSLPPSSPMPERSAPIRGGGDMTPLRTSPQ